MNKPFKILFYLNSAIAIAFGGLYLLKHDLMNYHYAFMGITEQELYAFNPRTLELMEFLKKLVGGGFIAIGAGGFILTAKATVESIKWIRWALLLTFMIGNVPTFLVSHYVASQIESGSKPPWLLSLAVVVLIIFGFIFSYHKRKEQLKK